MTDRDHVTSGDDLSAALRAQAGPRESASSAGIRCYEAADEIDRLRSVLELVRAAIDVALK